MRHCWNTKWIPALDATVRTLYGRHEEARASSNSMKPGWASHVYKVLLFSEEMPVVNVDVQAGNKTASHCARATLQGWLDARE